MKQGHSWDEGEASEVHMAQNVGSCLLLGQSRDLDKCTENIVRKLVPKIKGKNV